MSTSQEIINEPGSPYLKDIINIDLVEDNVKD